MAFDVYILASQRNGTLYVEMTDVLPRRAWEHRESVVPGFTRKHGVKRLVWYEQHGSRESEFQRERRIKKCNRSWKIELIEAANPDWQDVFDLLG